MPVLAKLICRFTTGFLSTIVGPCFRHLVKAVFAPDQCASAPVTNRKAQTSPEPQGQSHRRKESRLFFAERLDGACGGILHYGKIGMLLPHLSDAPLERHQFAMRYVAPEKRTYHGL